MTWNHRQGLYKTIDHAKQIERENNYKAKLIQSKMAGEGMGGGGEQTAKT